MRFIGIGLISGLITSSVSASNLACIKNDNDHQQYHFQYGLILEYLKTQTVLLQAIRSTAMKQDAMAGNHFKNLLAQQHLLNQDFESFLILLNAIFNPTKKCRRYKTRLFRDLIARHDQSRTLNLILTRLFHVKKQFVLTTQQLKILETELGTFDAIYIEFSQLLEY